MSPLHLLSLSIPLGQLIIIKRDSAYLCNIPSALGNDSNSEEKTATQTRALGFRMKKVSQEVRRFAMLWIIFDLVFRGMMHAMF